MTDQASRTLDVRRLGLVVIGLFCAAVGVIALVDAVLSPVPRDISDAMLAYGVLLYSFLGVVVLWRRPGHGIGRLAVTIALFLAVGLLLTVLAHYGPPTEGVRTILDRPLQFAVDVSALLSEVLLAGGLLLSASLLLVWFPDGHRTSRLGAIIEVTLIVSVVALVVASLKEPVLREIRWSAAKEAAFDGAAVIGVAGIAFAYLGAWVDLGLRYRRADDTHRTQMRWVWSAEGVSLACGVALVVSGGAFDWLWLVWFASLGLPAIAIAIAISRYHLYEIDRIVSRSITYVVLTAVLFVAFAATTLLLQRLVSSAVAPNGEVEPWVVAASTLVVAALFNPVRTRVQAAVDRRFHRERYDSAGIVAGFAGRLRGQIDLPTVSRELASTAAHALEPSTTAVWLRSRG